MLFLLLLGQSALASQVSDMMWPILTGRLSFGGSRKDYDDLIHRLNGAIGRPCSAVHDFLYACIDARGTFRRVRRGFDQKLPSPSDYIYNERIFGSDFVHCHLLNRHAPQLRLPDFRCINIGDGRVYEPLLLSQISLMRQCQQLVEVDLLDVSYAGRIQLIVDLHINFLQHMTELLIPQHALTPYTTTLPLPVQKWVSRRGVVSLNNWQLRWWSRYPHRTLSLFMERLRLPKVVVDQCFSPQSLLLPRDYDAFLAHYLAMAGYPSVRTMLRTMETIAGKSLCRTLAQCAYEVLAISLELSMWELRMSENDVRLWSDRKLLERLRDLDAFHIQLRRFVEIRASTLLLLKA